jgi:ATP-dependent RNA helicase RhlE
MGSGVLLGTKRFLQASWPQGLRRFLLQIRLAEIERQPDWTYLMYQKQSSAVRGGRGARSRHKPARRSVPDLPPWARDHADRPPRDPEFARRSPSFSPPAAPLRPQPAVAAVRVQPPEPELNDGENAFSALLPELQRAVADAGYTTPTPVQKQCIPHVLEGRDVLGSAQTGTGKTAAFVLPLLQYLVANPRRTMRRQPRMLILAPTRELAAQIGQSIQEYGRHLQVRHFVIFGGVGQRPQEVAMNRGVDILVATPGRLLDLMNQGFVDLRNVEAFVLDEADRMLDMGFLPDVRRVIAALPQRRQTLFFSATLPPEVMGLAKTLVRDPVRVSIAPKQPAVERIEQRVMFVERGQKDALLKALLTDGALAKVIVFTQMKHAANRLAEKLAAIGVPATAIHGNKSQTARTKALEQFRHGRMRVLVATDIAARGIDVDGITHVINYDLPREPETYVHRIGRTARAGADGNAVSFCAPHEAGQLRDIQRLIRREVPVDRAHAFHSEVRVESGSPRGRQVARASGPMRRSRFGRRR